MRRRAIRSSIAALMTPMVNPWDWRTGPGSPYFGNGAFTTMSSTEEGVNLPTSVVDAFVAVIADAIAKRIAAALAATMPTVGPTGPWRLVGVDGTWSLPPEMLGQAVVYMTTSFIMGLAFGAMFLASAPAIVLYSLLPGGWALLSTIPALEVPARWLDNAHTLTPMADHVLSGTEWARAGTTLALWVLLPAVIGAWRVIHDEV